MIKVTSPASRDKAPTRLANWLAALAEMAGTRLFARDDLTAINHGWQITQYHGGLGRRYRDPRFGSLLACPDCGGHATLGEELCAPCRGAGRITTEPFPAGGGGRT